jgi:hypothetical protein
MTIGVPVALVEPEVPVLPADLLVLLDPHPAIRPSAAVMAAAASANLRICVFPSR